MVLNFNRSCLHYYFSIGYTSNTYRKTNEIWNELIYYHFCSMLDLLQSKEMAQYRQFGMNSGSKLNHQDPCEKDKHRSTR